MVIETGFPCIPTIKESDGGEKESACLIFWLSGWELIGGGEVGEDAYLKDWVLVRGNLWYNVHTIKTGRMKTRVGYLQEWQKFELQ